MRFRRFLVIGVVLLVVATVGLTSMAVIALHEVSSQHVRLSKNFAFDLIAAEELRTRGEELAAARQALPTRATLEPWLDLWDERTRVVIAEIRKRSLDPIGRSHLNDIERAVAECRNACLSMNEERARAAHDGLEAAISRFVDREATLFDRALSRVDESTSRFQITLVILTIMILAAGISLAAVATRKIDHLFSREQTATARAQQEAAARQEVLAMVSHDLRTPLSAIVLGSALLAENIPDTGEPRGPRRQVQLIRNAADRMTDLIDAILDTARIEAGTLKVHVTSCDVDELLDKTIEMSQLRAAAKSITLRREPLPARLEVKADPVRLLQILSNLTSNAVKFTPAGGEIIASAEPKGDHVVFTIQDTGPGIPQDQLEHVFDPYWQAAGSEQRSSLGLGLFICKSLVEAHGGKIWVETREGGGSQFRFTIPS